jgi:calcium/calmodulin-dependent protein kinase kinase 2
MDDNGNILISDFGVSTQLENPEKYMIRGTEGTRHFCSPECLGTTGDVEYSGRSSDIWSLGVCLYVYIYLKLPFNVEVGGLNNLDNAKFENEGALTLLF